MVVLGVAVNLGSTVTHGVRPSRLKKADDGDSISERRDREERMTMSHRGCARSLPKW